jgi:hypothetical protein
MNKNSKFKLMIVSMSLFFVLQNQVVLSRSDSGSDDPFAHIQYSQVFDQTSLYKKYRTLMYKLGCAENVFASQADADSITKKADDSLNQSVSINKYTILPFDPISDAKELAAFEKECIQRLNNARRISIMTPTVEGLSNLAFMGIVGASINGIDKVSPGIFGDSVGQTSLGALLTALYTLKGIMGAGYNLIYWPDNSLEDLENHFAKNKCYIPKALWPKIEKEFIAARGDLYHREQHTHFLRFALGFTVYKLKPTITFKYEMSVEDIKNELNKRIDTFFGDYKNNLDINYIKINVAKFVDVLTNNDESITPQAPRYLYLYGSGGIGKTHFVQTLSDWINELIPTSVGFEEVIINSSIDLEGSENSPGTFLKALRNQLIQNKRGSVIMMDEATWLNSGGMVSPAKRIFNGDRSKLITSYFGSNMDGTGVSLEIPPMLIFVASNEAIADPALESRFDTVFYPAPLQERLITYGINIAEKSAALKQADCAVNKELIAKWVQSFDEKSRNFRFVAGNVEALLLVNNK